MEGAGIYIYDKHVTPAFMAGNDSTRHDHISALLGSALLIGVGFELTCSKAELANLQTLFFPGISSPFRLVAFFRSLCFPLTRQTIYIYIYIYFAGVLIPAKFFFMVAGTNMP